MNALQKLAVSCFGKLKVVHGISGRLRVNVWGVRQYPELVETYSDLLLSRLEKLAGVKDVSLCKLTGNLLIVYDPKKNTQAAIILWLNSAWKAVIELLADNSLAEADPKAVAKAVKTKLDHLE